MTNKWIRSIAMALVMAFMLELVPAQAFATDAAAASTTAEPEQGQTTELETEQTSQEETSQSETTQEEAYVLYEVEQLREESIKQFRMSDGSTLAVSYGEPVHFENANGVLAEIDNRLHVTRSSAAQTAAYTTTAGSWTGRYAQVIQNDFLFAMERDGFVASFCLVSNEPDATIDPVQPPVEVMSGQAQSQQTADQTADLTAESDQTVPGEPAAPASEEPQDTATQDMATQDTAVISAEQMDFASQQIEAQILGANDALSAQTLTEPTDQSQLSWQEQIYPEKLNSALIYEDVFPGVDLKYENGSTGIKESILVNTLQDSYTYIFRLNLENLQPVLQEDGGILLRDAGGVTRYAIPAPYMTDADGEFSQAVTYTLQPDSDGSYLLAVDADAQWIADAALPVTIDPTIIDKTDSSNNIFATFVRQGYPTTSSADQQDVLRVGYYTDASTTEQESQIYGYINTLPTIPTGSVLVDAQFGLCQSFNLAGGGTTTSLYVNAYELNPDTVPTDKKSWITNLTWNSRPSHDATVQDYQKLTNSTNGSYSWWSLTRMAAKWYDGSGSNKGFALIVNNASTMARRVSFRGTNSSTGYKPIFAVTYRSITGTEGYYSTQSQSVGRAGTAYAGDFNHQLCLVQTDANISSTINPFSISHVYNSNWAMKNFDEDSTAASHIQAYTGWMGGGWKLSAQETCNYIVLTDGQYSSYIIYNDADGTEHYFYPNASGVYEDEDGMGLKMTYSHNASGHSQYTMTDDKGNTKFFYNGYLLYTKDTSGNYLYYCYDGAAYSASSTAWKPLDYTVGHKLTGVYRVNNGCAAEKLVTLTYSGSYLASLTDHTSSQTISYTYGCIDAVGTKYLTQVTFADGAIARYEYDGSYRMIAAYDQEAGYGVEYSYNRYRTSLENIYEFSDATGASITTKRTTAATGRTYGVKMHGYRAAIYETQYREYGNDHTPNNSDDILTSYMFDSFGRTICSYSMDHDRAKMYGAETSTYTNNSATSKKNNRTTSASTVGIQGINLLDNTSLESGDTTANTATSWSPLISESNTNTVIKSDGPVRTGGRAIKTYVGASATGTKRVGYYQTVNLTANTTYTFSAYANSSLLSSHSAGNGLYIAFTNTSGAELKASSKIDYATSTAIEKGWERLQVTFTPSATGQYRVAVYQQASVGVAGFDDLQLEVGDAPTSYNLLQNASAEQGSNYWSLFTGCALSTSNVRFGTNALRITGDSASQRRTTQTVTTVPSTVTSTANTLYSSDSTFVLSGWVKANAAPNGVAEVSTYTDRFLGLMAVITYRKLDSETTAPTETHCVPFNSFCTDWQYTSGMIVPKKSGRIIQSIEIRLAYDNNLNKAYFDGISLTMEPVQTYKYNDDGNLVSASSTQNSPQTYTYTGANLTSMVDGGNGTYTYTYDSANRVRTATNDTAVQTTNYASNGNVTSTNWGKSGSTTSHNLKSFANYDSTGNYAINTSDGNGIVTQNTYAVDKLYESTTGSQNTICYRYLSKSDRMSSTYQQGVISLAYGYANGAVNRLTRKSFDPSGNTFWQTYKFTSDGFGNTTGIYVGSDSGTTGAVTSADQRLVSYTYEDAGGVYNGNLTRMTYGNGSYVEYTYDTFGRVVAETYRTSAGAFEARYVYLYASNGDLAKQYVEDANGNIVSSDSFEYDGLDRLIRSRSTNSSGSTVQRTEHKYDTDNRIASQSWQMGNRTYTQNYTYRSVDGALTTVATTGNGATDTLNYVYDGIKRLQSRSNSIYKQAYIYKMLDASTYRSSTLVAQLKYSAEGSSGLSALTYDYTYDSNGNILTVKENGTTKATYTYDGQNQLASETDAGGTLNYVYDTAGNILRVDVVGIGTYKTFTYGDGAWQDLLTSYNGNSISYDDAGNPTSYYNGSRQPMTWTQGRRLASVQKGGVTTTYTYDLSGVRTSKTVGSTTYNFVTQNGQVVRQTWSGNTLDIVYDDKNVPYYCVYTPSGGSATTYYYITNNQGDVTRLVTATGATAASYSYTAWGDVSVTNSSGYNIGTVNPIRYRGYYYDAETGFYYLQSRYYDPVICRFINADAPELSEMTAYNVSNSNMFAYCGNNPVMRGDANGEFWHIVVGAVVGALCEVISARLSGEKVSVEGVVLGAAMGALGAVSSFKAVAAAVNSFSTVATCVQAGVDPLTSLALGATTAATSLIGFGKLFKGDSAGRLAETVISSQISVVSSITTGAVIRATRKNETKTSYTTPYKPQKTSRKSYRSVYRMVNGKLVRHLRYRPSYSYRVDRNR